MNTLLALLVLGAFAVPSAQAQAQDNWTPLRWQASNGPRDVEYARSSVTTAGGILSVKIRRDRATAIKQDPTIAPETDPWTLMEMELDCVQKQWRPRHFQSVNAEGRQILTASTITWVKIESPSLAAAVRLRLCPAA